MRLFATLPKQINSDFIDHSGAFNHVLTIILHHALRTKIKI